jgi:hypothetical protein
MNLTPFASLRPCGFALNPNPCSLGLRLVLGETESLLNFGRSVRMVFPWIKRIIWMNY